MTFPVTNTCSQKVEQKPEITPSEALIQAIDKMDSDGVRVALKNGANPDSHSHKWPKEPVLHQAAKKGNSDITGLLLEGQANPNILSETFKTTPLHEACKWACNEEVVALLLQNGADYTVRSEVWQATPLECVQSRLHSLAIMPGAKEANAKHMRALRAMEALLQEKIVGDVSKS